MDVVALGSLALWASLPLATAAMALGARRRGGVAPVSALASALTVAVGVLVHALLAGDFRLVYVADTTTRAGSWPSRFAALWGGMAGSLLFWTWLLALAAVGGTWLAHRRHPRLAGHVSAVLGGLVGAFAAVSALLADPFARLAIPAIDGGGLVPILERPAMLYHPPLLYAGLVGLAVPFALAVAGLLAGALDRAWLRSVRVTTGIAWVLLTLGMVTGAHWAYGELGWGGYWAWDPIENSSLLPWLAATALLHAVLVDEHRGHRPAASPARVSTAALATLPFVLVTIGSVLTRSGAAPSVHAFAEAPTVGGALLGLVAVVSTLAVIAVCVAWRQRPVADAPAPRKRSLWDIALTANGVVLAGVGLVVATGTLYPLVAGLGDEPIAVAGGFFARFTAPLAVIAVGLLGTAPYLRRSGGATPALRRTAPLAGAAAAVGLVAAVIGGARHPFALAVLPIAAASATLLLTDGVARIRAGSVSRRAGLGGTVAHLGVVLLLAGFAGSTAVEATSVVLSPGGSAIVGPYVVRHDGVDVADVPVGGQRVAVTLGITRDGEPVGQLRPAQVVFAQRGLVRADPALRSTALDDLQIVLRRVDADELAALDLAVRPLVGLVWAGGVLIALGGGLALLAGQPVRRPPASVSLPGPPASLPAGGPASPSSSRPVVRG